MRVSDWILVLIKKKWFNFESMVICNHKFNDFDVIFEDWLDNFVTWTKKYP